MGKGSGIDSVKLALEKFQMKADDDQMMKILLSVKQRGLDTKSLLSDEDFKKIAEGVIAGEAVA
jgi:isopropylmalate/homocitrate/citramalate synthase